MFEKKKQNIRRQRGSYTYRSCISVVPRLHGVCPMMRIRYFELASATSSRRFISRLNAMLTISSARSDGLFRNCTNFPRVLGMGNMNQLSELILLTQFNLMIRIFEPPIQRFFTNQQNKSVRLNIIKKLNDVFKCT